MSLPQPERMAVCMYPTPGLRAGEAYMVKVDGLDPLTRAPMVQLADGSQWWAFRFSPGPPAPPMDLARVRWD